MEIPCISLALTIILCIVIGIVFYVIRKIIEKSGGDASGLATGMSVLKSILCLGLWVWFIFGIVYAHPNDMCGSTVSFKEGSKFW